MYICVCVCIEEEATICIHQYLFINTLCCNHSKAYRKLVATIQKLTESTLQQKLVYISPYLHLRSLDSVQRPMRAGISST